MFCISSNVFWVQVSQASSPAEANAEWRTEQAAAFTAMSKSMPGMGLPKPNMVNQPWHR